MNYKSILILTVTVAMALTSCGGAQNDENAAPEKKEIGLQLYSVRHLLDEGAPYESNLAALLDTLGKMGYTQVEAASYNADQGTFYGLSPEDYAKAAADAGIKALSSHTGRSLTADELKSGDLTEYYAWWDKAIKDHKAAGMSYIVLPWMSVPETLADLQKQCDALSEVGRRAAGQGISVGYHNHSHEFTKVEGTPMLDYMIEHTDPEAVFFELDVYWAMMGQASPVDYFKKYPGRFRLLHIKDRREIGQSGMVGFDAIFNNADVAGLENYFVEIEEFTDGAEKGTKDSADYLIAAPFVKASYASK